MFVVKFTSDCLKQLKKLDKGTASLITGWIRKNLEGTANSRQHGKSLTGDKSGRWRYRIGDYRLICNIQDKELVILALKVGHRKDVYK